MRLRLQPVLTVFALALALCVMVPAVPAQRTKRLILTDGSYQAATQWEIQGDRVHYFSSERHEWEDVPKSLIDWKATDEYNSGKGDLRPSDPTLRMEMKKEDEEEAAERVREAAQTPTVAPGLKLPSEGGVILLDEFGGRPALAIVAQNGSELNKHTGRNILRAAINPIPSGAKQSIELKGSHARVQAHTTTPEIYLDIEQAPQEEPVSVEDRFRVVRVQSKKDHRVVGNLKVSLLGEASEQTSAVKVRVERFSGDWVRLIPLENLAPGEYAVLEMLGPKTINTFVWDFGVDPSAPANPTAWKPEAPKQKPTNPDANPVLIPKKP